MADNKTLAVKYRPKTFNDMVEQDAVKAILSQQLKTGTTKQAYLFCGPAGDGKTTTARIFANELNDGKGRPIEIDAASNNGVDQVREIIDESKKKPLEGKFKVFIIDECHAISSAGWQAFLKVLEEPPATAVFLLCTTDPQKIPETILSRVQRYNFSKISLDGISKRLKCIIEEENKFRRRNKILYNPAALDYIAKLADGGMRDAITTLDKCLSLSSDLTMETVLNTTGTLSNHAYFRMTEVLTQQDIDYNSAVEIIEEIYNSGKDVKKFMKDLQYFLLDILKLKLFGSYKYVKIPKTEESVSFVDCFNYGYGLDLLDFLVKLNADLKWEENPKDYIQCNILLFGR